MGFATPLAPLPTQLKQRPSSPDQRRSSSLLLGRGKRPTAPVARLFGPAIFEASKLKVLFLGVDEEKHPAKLPRTYTLTHSDITSKLTLAISNTINRAQLQGWYHKLQRDEVVAEWKKARGGMSLHVHCHISGDHVLLDFIAGLRYYIFRKELPLVLKAFVHGDGSLFSRHPELEEATVWVYFHSNKSEFNRVEWWGPLWNAAEMDGRSKAGPDSGDRLSECPVEYDGCFPATSLMPCQHDFKEDYR